MEFTARLMLAFASVLGLAMTVWGGYYFVTALMSWRRPMDYGRHPARTRFAVLIAARNEELVIGSLVNSLLTQNYPPELYDVYVIPNNCTDNTAQAARQFRRQGTGVHRSRQEQGRGHALCLQPAGWSWLRRLLRVRRGPMWPIPIS